MNAFDYKCAALEIRGLQSNSRVYELALLIIFTAAGVYKFINLKNNKKSKQHGFEFAHHKNISHPDIEILASKFLKYHDRFGNLPSDKLAKEWLDEIPGQ